MDSGARGGYQSKQLLAEGFVGLDWQARFRPTQRMLQAEWQKPSRTGRTGRMRAVMWGPSPGWCLWSPRPCGRQAASLIEPAKRSGLVRNETVRRRRAARRFAVTRRAGTRANSSSSDERPRAFISFGSRPTRGSTDWSVWPVGVLGFDLGAPRRRSASARDLATLYLLIADGHRNNQEPGVLGAASRWPHAASCLLSAGDLFDTLPTFFIYGC